MRRSAKTLLAGAIWILSTGLAPPAFADTTLLEDDFTGVRTTLPNGEVKPYPDRTKWAFTFWPGTRWKDSYGDGTNWLEGNGESQTYLNAFLVRVKGKFVTPEQRYDPFLITPDGLRIRASLLTPQQQVLYGVGGHRRFGSGMLLSRRSFKYGKVRMVAKLPNAPGTWPALWMLPTSKQWPPEIDIFEGMAWGPHKRQLHIAALTTKDDTAAKLAKWVDIPADPSEGFHEYGLDWDDKQLRFLFDGKVLAVTPTPRSMQEPMYVIVNLAVGGKWPYNELKIPPIDSLDPKRLEAGASKIEKGLPADLVIRSLKITQTDAADGGRAAAD